MALSNSGAILLGTGSAGGLELYDMAGARIGAISGGAITGVDARRGLLSGDFIDPDFWTVATLDEGRNRLQFHAVNTATGAAQDLTAREIALGFAGESLCLYRNALDDNLYAFALGGNGEIAQFVLFARDGRVDARLVRQLHIASEASHCVADDASGDLYVAEQAIGIWRFGANPEMETVPELIDAVRLGRIEEEVGGVALYRAGAANYLIASNASANTLNIYDHARDHAFVGAFSIAARGDVDGVEAAGGLYATSRAFGARFPEGLLIATDEADDLNGVAGANYKIISWADIAGALNLTRATEGREGTRPLPHVIASAETAPVEADGDAADDPAIWAHPTDPSRSLIIGTQKQSGLYVYDLNGAVLQFLPDGRMNNVDVRDSFMLSGRATPIVAASNRTDDSIALYRIDAATRRLINVAEGAQPTGFADPYGLCLYRSARSGRFFVFVTEPNGAMRQWELLDAGNGRVRTNLAREFLFGSQIEGCVADDATGALYVAEEDIGLWRMNAEPDGGDARRSVATVADNPALKDDLEGVAIYDLGGGRGYIVLSSQGNNSYAVFAREGDNAYLGSFAITADGATGIDGASETDGLDVTSVSLGGAYAHGLLVVQDGRNVAPPENQNFKFVPWAAIASALGLEQR